MATADVEHPPPEPAPTDAAPAIPDYLASPNAVFGDEGVQWRYGTAPDYSKTRKVWEEGKKMNHAAGSLPQLVENLVKNWEVEASFKPRLQDWRTIDHENYTFAINGGPPQSAEHMLKVGTYNAIITPNEYYDPANSDFASSHKTFKRMMPTFAWEVIEVYSGPPTVAFKWRHWGSMKNDYVGFNDKGEKITAKAHGGPIDIQGITIATVDDKVRLQAVDTYFDPLEMFRQIAPQGVVNREAMNHSVDRSDAMDPILKHDGISIAAEHQPGGVHAGEKAPGDLIPPHISNSTGQPADAFVPHQGADTTLKPTDADTRSSQREDRPTGGAQQIVATAEVEGTNVDIEHPPSTFGAGACPFLSQHAPIVSSDQGADTSPPPQPPQDHPTVPPATSDPAEPESNQSSEATNISLTSTNPDPDTINTSNDNPTTSTTDESRATGTHDAVDALLERSAADVHPHPKDVEQAVQPQAGEAVAAPAGSDETRATKEEMSALSAEDRPLLMNRE